MELPAVVKPLRLVLLLLLGRVGLAGLRLQLGEEGGVPWGELGGRRRRVERLDSCGAMSDPKELGREVGGALIVHHGRAPRALLLLLCLPLSASVSCLEIRD